MDHANAKVKLNPRLWPPLIGLGLLLVIAMAILFSRGGQPRQDAENDDQLEARIVRRVEQTPNFTYLELEDGDGTMWLAAPRVDVQVGDRVHFKPAREFRDFEVRSLKRKFNRLLSADQLFKRDAGGHLVALESTSDGHGRDLTDDPHGVTGHGIPGHGGMAGHGSDSGTTVKVPKIDKAEGGQTLAEIAASPGKFSGQTIKVRGVIVSARQRVRPAPGQPATNWYRLQDGSGADPLLFTSDDVFSLDDLVTISGKLTTDKDFGGGLSYKMIVERASVTREAAGKEKSEARSTKSETNSKMK